MHVHEYVKTNSSSSSGIFLSDGRKIFTTRRATQRRRRRTFENLGRAGQNFENLADEQAS